MKLFLEIKVNHGVDYFDNVDSADLDLTGQTSNLKPKLQVETLYKALLFVMLIFNSCKPGVPFISRAQPLNRYIISRRRYA